VALCLDTDRIIRLAEQHPELSNRTEMIRKWRRGEAMPSLRTLLAIINHHRIEPGILFKEKKNATNNESHA